MVRRGFSFIELVVVLAIGALVAGIAIPRMGGASIRYQADFLARRIVLDFDRARENARLTGATQTLTFDPSNHRYSVSGTGSGSTAAYTIELDDTYNARISSVDFGGNVASFSAFGECSAGGTVTVRLGNTTRTITLDAASGRARWQ